MHFHHQAVGCAIRGHGEVAQTVPHVGVIGLHHQRTGAVVTARRADSGDKGLVVGFLHSDMFGGWLAVVGVDFVGASKQQMLVVILEVVGDLRPVGLLLGVNRCLVGVQRVFFQPAAVPVTVDDDVHAIVDGVIDHFLNTCQPGRVDRGVGGVTVPSDGDADGVEPGSLDRIDELLRHDRVAPSSFTPRCGLERVPQIPPDFDLGRYLRCRRQRGLGVRPFGDKGQHCKHECKKCDQMKDTLFHHRSFLLGLSLIRKTGKAAQKGSATRMFQ